MRQSREGTFKIGKFLCCETCYKQTLVGYCFSYQICPAEFSVYFFNQTSLVFLPACQTFLPVCRIYTNALNTRLDFTFSHKPLPQSLSCILDSLLSHRSVETGNKSVQMISASSFHMPNYFYYLLSLILSLSSSFLLPPYKFIQSLTQTVIVAPPVCDARRIAFLKLYSDLSPPKQSSSNKGKRQERIYQLIFDKIK